MNFLRKNHSENILHLIDSYAIYIYDGSDEEDTDITPII